MNRKNLTAAVLAGIAGVAGIAGTAQAVNVNPDGLGQVLIYPYYTSNDGNQTLLSVVNTTDQGKAVKVRFLEGFNSREVLDFNLYMSHHDVWVGAIFDNGGVPTLAIPDNSCTVPYLYERNQIELPNGAKIGYQEFLDLAYTDYSEELDKNGDPWGPAYDFSDGGPTGIGRAAEGHFEMIEMGTIYNDTIIGKLITHETDTGMPPVSGDAPFTGVCGGVVQAWAFNTDDSNLHGQWIKDILGYIDEDDEVVDPTNDKGVGTFNIDRNSGGLFGGAAVVNAENGSMFAYDAIAVQGFDKFEDTYGLNYQPGTIYPSLNSGDQDTAYLFFGPPTNEPWAGFYEGTATNYFGDEFDASVDAVSAVFMKSNIVNEYVLDDLINAGTEWIITFPTKNFYADIFRLNQEGLFYLPMDGMDLDLIEVDIDDSNTYADEGTIMVFEFPVTGWDCAPVFHPNAEPGDDPLGYLPSSCELIPRPPFTKYFGETQLLQDDVMGDFIAPDCEVVWLKTWNREEGTFMNPDDPDGGFIPPVVSPSLPGCINGEGPGCPDVVQEVPFQLCNEVNILRFGDEVVFGTPTFDQPHLEGLNNSLLVEVQNEAVAGWGRVRFDSDAFGNPDPRRKDSEGLVGLPVTGFAAYEFENGLFDGVEGEIKANYGGLFKHKGLVTRTLSSIDD